jgi:Domain of unknown function (DUF4461)
MFVHDMHLFDQSRVNGTVDARTCDCQHLSVIVLCSVSSEWLQKNVDRARQNSVQTAAIRNDIVKLKEIITEETGVADIQWQCNWTLPSFRTALRGLLRVCRQHASDINVKGIFYDYFFGR